MATMDETPKRLSDRELAAQGRNVGNGWSNLFLVLGVLFTFGPSMR
jgi:hypothetical protein